MSQRAGTSQNEPCSSYPPADGRCIFLALPAELRNIIYQYALSYDEGLLVRQKDKTIFTYHALHDGVSDDDEANQLRYVCRQFRADTKNILLCLNNLVFKGTLVLNTTGEDLTTGAMYAERFLQRCPVSIHTHLQKLIVFYKGFSEKRSSDTPKERINDMIGDSSALSQFCRQNPRVEILLRFHWKGRHADQCATNYFRSNYLFKKLVRPEASFLMLRQEVQTLWDNTVVTMSSSEKFANLHRVHLPPNLRVAITETFPAIFANNTPDDWPCIYGLCGPASNQNNKQIFTAARKLFDEGL